MRSHNRALILWVHSCALSSCSDPASLSTVQMDGGRPATVSILDAATEEMAVEDASARGPHADDASPGPDAAIPDAASSPDATGCEMTASVLTFNLDHDIRDRDARTQMVVDLINARMPDLVAFQEASQSPIAENRAEVIGDHTGYAWAWSRASGYDGVFEAGPAILSHWTIRETRDIRLPRPIVPNLVERTIVGAHVISPCGEIGFFSTHIGEIDDIDPSFTPDLAVAAYNFVLAYRTGAANILGAGINAEPDSVTSQMLRGDMSYKGTTGTLRDSWIASSTTASGGTYPSSDPRHRIDYLYLLDGARVTTSVLGCETVLKIPVGGVYPSDHIGVLCRYHVVFAAP
jgi:endonuclease/exonuclease/phosphatase family metal-dependent hydrolase